VGDIEKGYEIIMGSVAPTRSSKAAVARLRYVSTEDWVVLEVDV
jgi:hypothetical protein